MKEKIRLGQLCKKLREDCVGAVVMKLNDRVAKAFPDTVMTWTKKTLWLEAKHVKDEASFQKAIKTDSLQYRMMRRLERHGLALYVIFDDTVNGAYLVMPSALPSYRTSHVGATKGKKSQILEGLVLLIKGIFL